MQVRVKSQVYEENLEQTGDLENTQRSSNRAHKATFKIIQEQLRLFTEDRSRTRTGVVAEMLHMI